MDPKGPIGFSLLSNCYVCDDLVYTISEELKHAGSSRTVCPSCTSSGAKRLRLEDEGIEESYLSLIEPIDPSANESRRSDELIEGDDNVHEVNEEVLEGIEESSVADEHSRTYKEKEKLTEAPVSIEVFQKKERSGNIEEKKKTQRRKEVKTDDKNMDVDEILNNIVNQDRHLRRSHRIIQRKIDLVTAKHFKKLQKQKKKKAKKPVKLRPPAQNVSGLTSSIFEETLPSPAAPSIDLPDQSEEPQSSSCTLSYDIDLSHPLSNSSSLIQPLILSKKSMNSLRGASPSDEFESLTIPPFSIDLPDQSEEPQSNSCTLSYDMDLSHPLSNSSSLIQPLIISKKSMTSFREASSRDESECLQSKETSDFANKVSSPTEPLCNTETNSPQRISTITINGTDSSLTSSGTEETISFNVLCPQRSESIEMNPLQIYSEKVTSNKANCKIIRHADTIQETNPSALTPTTSSHPIKLSLLKRQQQRSSISTRPLTSLGGSFSSKTPDNRPQIRLISSMKRTPGVTKISDQSRSFKVLHKNNEDLQCGDCGTLLNNPKEMVIHFKVRSDYGCACAFLPPSMKECDVVKHTKQYHCEADLVTFTVLQSDDARNKIMVKCSKCSEFHGTLKTMKQLEIHIRMRHIPIRCLLCGEPIEGLQRFFPHMSEHYEKKCVFLSMKEFGKPCSKVCGNVESLVSALESSDTMVMNLCSICKSPCLLINRHVYHVIKELKKEYVSQCPMCQRRLTIFSENVQHLLKRVIPMLSGTEVKVIAREDNKVITKTYSKR